VQLLAAQPDIGALLLERLNPHHSLRNVELLTTAEVAGGLLRRLAVPAPDGLPQLGDIAEDLADSLPEQQNRLGRPVPGKWLNAACGLARDFATQADKLLVHTDLHYGNFLAGQREPWLAVDPKPVMGDPERAVPELLWTRLDEVDGAAGLRRLLAALVDAASLDAEAARGWAIVRCVDYWLWGLQAGLTGDPVRCQRILEVLG